MDSSRTVGRTSALSRLDRDNQELYRALDRLVRAYQFRDRQHACYYELSVNECYALQTILRHEGMTQKELAANLLLDKSTTSRLVADMEDNGLVRRSADPADARVQRLHATRSGVRLHDRVQQRVLDRQRDLIADLPSEARRAAILVLQRMADTAVRAFSNDDTPSDS